MQTIIRILAALSLLVLIGAGAKCHRTVTITHTCPIGQRCTISTKVQVEYLTGDSLNGQKEDVANGVYIVDLANPWAPDSSFTPQATFEVMTDSGIVSQTFDLSYDLSTSQTFSRVDSETTPRAFVFSSPSAVESFLASAAAASSSPQPETVADVTFAVTQTDCAADSGKYINHLRYENGSSLSYFETVYIQYTQSPSAPLVCNQGEIDILE